MKREKLQALRCDFMSTREQGDHPKADQARGSGGTEYTNTHDPASEQHTHAQKSHFTANKSTPQQCLYPEMCFMCGGLF